ncbi:MAG: N-acetyltransferase [Verrucomicrobiales bacterium]|nr:N-acetyltransferase [Verrucomicrobiales bacterium]
MNSADGIIIRPEQPQDASAISRVIERAFQSAPHSGHTEHFIVAALRRAEALSVSLVAEKLEQVVGHVAFSPVRFSDATAGWFGLGPVAVLPEFQQQGIGTTLVHSGLAALRSLEASGCVVLGEPGYYLRFGFRHRPECRFAGAPAEYFLTLSFRHPAPEGPVTYHDAFGAEDWP